MSRYAFATPFNPRADTPDSPHWPTSAPPPGCGRACISALLLVCAIVVLVYGLIKAN
jgi:hypothetical protein